MGVAYLGYLSGTPVTSGNIIPMTQILRRHCSSVGTDLVLRGNGYYTVTINTTLASTAGGNATITLYQNGVPVTGAVATETIAANGATHISLTAVVRNTCCNNSSILTIGYTGPVLTSTVATVTIEG